jgi:hypothetical protein
MVQVNNTRAAYNKMSQQGDINEMNRAKTVQAITDAQDLVDVGGIKVPRDKVPSMVTAIADVKYKKGLIDDKQWMAYYDASMKEAHTQLYEAQEKGETEKIAKIQQEIVALKRKQQALTSMGSEADITKLPAADVLAAGGSPSSKASTVSAEKQAFSLLKENFFRSGMMGEMKNVGAQAQERYAVAKSFYRSFRDAGIDPMEAVEKATRTIEAEVSKYWQLMREAEDGKRRAQVKRAFAKAYHFIPKRDSTPMISED